MLVLASNSPRRKQLLTLGGWTFKIIPAEIDERPLANEQPQDYVLRLAEEKARAAVEGLRLAPPLLRDVIVIAADTTVADGMDILGKPEDSRQAEAMLRRLRGRVHTVFTALVVLRTSDGALLSDCCRTEVPMRKYSDEEMAAYIASGDPLDKAGAYAIQHDVFNPVESLWGCYANVMGLPLCHLTRTLEKLGVRPIGNIPQACQAALSYACPVYAQVLGGEL
jgi:MAF protein